MIKILWHKSPSVTYGGKTHFYNARVGEHMYHVVWNRIEHMYHAQIDYKTVGKFETVDQAQKFLEKEGK